MTNIINAPFGAQDVQNLTPTTGHTVTITVNNTGTIAKIGKLAANTTINVVAGEWLTVGAKLVIRTFNVNGGTHNILWGTGFYGATVEGVSNTAHYSSFMYDGSMFVQTSVQATTRNEIETVSATQTLELTVTGNTGTFVSTYTNAADAPDEWVVDATLTFSPELPVGTKVAISGLTGNYEVTGTTASVLWVSDILEAHTEEVPIRTKLNLHTGGSAAVTFIATLSGLAEDWTGNVITRVVTSKTTTEGSHQSSEAMTNINILGELVTSNITLDADVVE